MQSVIHKVILGNMDNEVHDAFLKFSRGKFDNRFLFEIKKQKGAWKIKTGPEYANFFVSSIIQGLEEKIKLTGAIITTLDLRESLGIPIERIKQFAGVKQYIINSEVECKKIREAISKFPRAFFALTLNTTKGNLKIKAKAPKSAKPSNKGDEEPKAEFCTLVTTSQEIVNTVAFGVKEFKDLFGKHTILVEDIEIPSGINNPVEIREKSKRSGKIIRDLKIDGKNVVEEFSFSKA